ncbi:hypothetical protein GCM10022236_02060 [Microlunatus ginsengisoli]|uniref:Uncharacterized protein n=1 Tax=Microlunatus ginsengisoli TaxID=363863 RepID=A0ABP6ZD24_9ACTN
MEFVPPAQPLVLTPRAYRALLALLEEAAAEARAEKAAGKGEGTGGRIAS